jgi:signal transduction histidine kinase
VLSVVTLAVAAVAAPWRPAAAQTPSARNVLTIYSGDVNSSNNQTVDAGIRQTLLSRRGRPVEYFTEFLESDRFSAVEASQALSDYIARKYGERRIDVVIAVTNRALRFALERRATLFRDAPIVFAAAGVTGGDLDRRRRLNLTGVTVGNAYAESLKLALALHPNTKRVFVVAITPNQRNFESLHAELQPFSRQVELAYVEPGPMTELTAAVKAIPPGSVILYVWYQRQGAEYVVDPLIPARVVADAAKVPVYGVVDTNLGTGIVGGIMRGTRETGAVAGSMASRILDGTPARAIPVEHAPVIPMFDWRQVLRWQIDPARLPAGSEIRFRVPTLWEAYRLYIMGVVVVLVAQLVLIGGLIAQRTRLRRADAIIRNREATLETSYERIRRLAGGLIKGQEAARAAIARELHDDVCQELVGVCVSISSLKRSTGRIQDPPAQEELSKLQEWAMRTVEGVRRLSHDLHPASLELLGLAAAMRSHCKEIGKRHDVQVHFVADGTVAGIPPDVALCLFRISQEALRNGIAHGGARRLAVSLRRTHDFLHLTISDDGRGFDLETVRHHGGGLGLVSIEERAHVVGGTVRILTRPEQGTTILVRVPAAAPASTNVVPLRGRPALVEAESVTAQLRRAIGSLRREVRRTVALRASTVRAAATKSHDSRVVAQGAAAAPQRSMEPM